MNQISFFDGKHQFKITNKIRLIELFAGYGSQHFALKYLGINAESYRICEWAVKSIQAYKDAHFPEDNTDYSADHSIEFVINRLFKWGISSNYNEPMTKDQIKRMGEQKCRQVYNNIKATHNLVNIQQAKASDFNIVDKDDFTYILTYSFPCQDLSKAGLGKGMEKGSGTRSGMLWEVERILEECLEGGALPQVLLMENVPDVIGTNNIKHFASWLAKLESFGYHCYWKVLNGRDYGIPQNRERCFMISILGDYLYEWPQTVPLTNKLRDLLEDEVDEKYYLSDKMLAYCTDMTNRNGFVRGERFSPIDTDKKDYGYAITTSAGQRPTDNFIIIKGKECPIVKDNENYIQWKQEGLLDSDCRAWRDDKVSGTLCDCLGVVNNCRIRKLTPKECFRLMGVKDEDFERIAKNQSNASLYHLAGDSIIVDVLMALFKQIV